MKGETNKTPKKNAEEEFIREFETAGGKLKGDIIGLPKPPKEKPISIDGGQQ